MNEAKVSLDTAKDLVRIAIASEKKLETIKELSETWIEGIDLEDCPPELLKEMEYKNKFFKEAGEILRDVLK